MEVSYVMGVTQNTSWSWSTMTSCSDCSDLKAMVTTGDPPWLKKPQFGSSASQFARSAAKTTRSAPSSGLELPTVPPLVGSMKVVTAWCESLGWKENLRRCLTTSAAWRFIPTFFFFQIMACLKMSEKMGYRKIHWIMVSSFSPVRMAIRMVIWVYLSISRDRIAVSVEVVRWQAPRTAGRPPFASSSWPKKRELRLLSLGLLQLWTGVELAAGPPIQQVPRIQAPPTSSRSGTCRPSNSLVGRTCSTMLALSETHQVLQLLWCRV